LLGAAFFVGTWLLARPWVLKRADTMNSKRKDLNKLFLLPLIISAGLLSFAHGANDVANAVGPLAAIVAASEGGTASMTNLSIPLWVMAIGAIGIAVGLALFGPRVIKTVGTRITKLDPLRAFCVALSAAATVLVASALGLPVSSTHIAVGGIFGVGLIREHWRNKQIPHVAANPTAPFLDVPQLNETPEAALKRYKKKTRRRLVRRQYLLGIIAAWLITVPMAALLSALIYYGLSHAMDT